MGDLRIYPEFRIFFFFTFVEKKNLSLASWLFFYRGKKWWYGSTLLQTCHSSRFNLDIPIFQYKSRSITITRFHVWKSQVFFCFLIVKQKGVSRCRMPHVSKPTKCGLKINFMIGWIDGLGWILCTPRLSEWSRLGLASLSRRPSLTWCYSSADPRNSAVFFRDPLIVSPFATIGAAKIGKVRNPKYIIQRNSGIKEATNFFKACLQFHFREATVSVTNNFFCQSSIKCDSEIIILKWSPPSRESEKSR